MTEERAACVHSYRIDSEVCVLCGKKMYEEPDVIDELDEIRREIDRLRNLRFEMKILIGALESSVDALRLDSLDMRLKAEIAAKAVLKRIEGDKT